MTKSENDGGFVSHLAELRKRLIQSFIFLIIFFIGCYFFAEYLYIGPSKYCLTFKSNMW